MSDQRLSQGQIDSIVDDLMNMLVYVDAIIRISEMQITKSDRDEILRVYRDRYRRFNTSDLSSDEIDAVAVELLLKHAPDTESIIAILPFSDSCKGRIQDRYKSMQNNFLFSNKESQKESQKSISRNLRTRVARNAVKARRAKRKK